MLRQFVDMVKLKKKLDKMEFEGQKKNRKPGRKYHKLSATLELIERDRDEYRQTFSDADVMGAYVTFRHVEDAQVKLDSN